MPLGSHKPREPGSIPGPPLSPQHDAAGIVKPKSFFSMEKVFIILLFVLASLHALGQATKVRPSLAHNVSVGETTVWSVYPDDADFVLNIRDQRLMLSTFIGPEASDWHTEYYVAHVGQVAPYVYRAEVSPMFWVEVHVLTGETFWYNSCVTTCYRIPCPDYSYGN